MMPTISIENLSTSKLIQMEDPRNTQTRNSWVPKLELDLALEYMTNLHTALSANLWDYTPQAEIYAVDSCWR